MRSLLPVTVWAVLATASAVTAQSNTDAFVAKIPGANMPSSVNLAVSNGAAGPGQTLQIPISLTSSGTAAPVSFQVDLAFDTTKLTFASAACGAMLTSANKGLSSTVMPNGNVRILTTGTNQAAIANGVAALVSFSLNASFANGTASVTLLNPMASSAGGGLATASTAGTVTPFTCDLNGDGSVNVADVQLMINQALGTVPAANDLNHDGSVNVADVQKEINAALGLGCAY
jgi:hypothetical protein